MFLAMTSRVESLSSVRRLARGSLWNVLGRVFSLVIAFVATPILLHHLGIERWGLFTLSLAVCGTFGILDLGVSAALTRALAERIGTSQERDAASLVLIAFIVLSISGFVGAAVAYSLVPLAVDHMLNVPPYLRDETILAFHVLAAAGPLIVLNAGMWGVLAAYQRFGLANIVNLPISLLYYIGPMLALALRADLVSVTIALVAVRGAQTLIYLLLLWRAVPDLLCRPRLKFSLLRGLVAISLWMTISNTLSSLIMQVDRLIVAGMLTLAATSYYSAPLDLVLRFIVIPIAISTAFFPAVATSYRTMPARSGALLRIGSLTTILAVWPPCLLVVSFPQELLTLWLGPEVAAASHTVLLILGIGTFVACASVLPGTFTDAIGRPDIGAKILLVQAVLFPPIIIVLVRQFGIEGAALAWTARCVISIAVRLWVCIRLCPQLDRVIRPLAWTLALGTAALAIYPLISPASLRLTAIILTAPVILIISVASLMEIPEMLRVYQYTQGWFGRVAPEQAVDRT
jgi:O-antigen/teichoic acid export membrane protein